LKARAQVRGVVADERSVEDVDEGFGDVELASPKVNRDRANCVHRRVHWESDGR
jgi:hypothetical protein